MSLIIYRSKDIEDAVRAVLAGHLTAYCRPLPADFTTPCILIQSVGGSTAATMTGKGKVDTFTVTLDARAESQSKADEYIRNAVAILEASGLNVSVNSLYSWGTDPARPDLAMRSATLLVTAHREQVSI